MCSISPECLLAVIFHRVNIKKTLMFKEAFTGKVMSEDIIQTIAQLQYENVKLVDELNHLRQHTLSVEETLNVQTVELKNNKKHLKSLEKQNDYFCQVAKEKDHLIDLLEQDKKKLSTLNQEISSEKNLLKEELQKEKFKNSQLESLKTQEIELKNAITKLKQENQRLLSELSLKSEECFTNTATIKDLIHHIKELECEKAEFLAMRDTLLSQKKEERLETSQNFEFFLRRGTEWSKSEMNLFTENLPDITPPSSRERVGLNLQEEFLESELREKNCRVGELESLLRKKEEEESERNRAIDELKRKLSNAGLLNYDPKVDIKLDSSDFNDIYNDLLKLLQRPDGHSGECKALTEVTSLTVVVKDGVQATQPSSVRIVETISIASQTDPVKNLSPVLPFKSFEKLQSDLQSDQLPSDSDDEGEESPLSMENRVRKGLQLFTDKKSSNLDMDIYRSCRKLSVLPEEDTDESFHRKSSLKNPNHSKFCSFDSKTQSADDIVKIVSSKSVIRSTSSFSNITSKNSANSENNSFQSFRQNHNSFIFNNSDKENKENDKINCNDDVELVITPPKDAFRQPHSFDSYLDFVKPPSSPLARQISDPTQNTGVESSISRRASYIRRPRSTCRPLTLPCDKGDKKKEDRICKVRFDLDGTGFRNDDSLMEKEQSPSQIANKAKTMKIVSRFRVEIVDEIEFRKSLEENSKNTNVNRKRPPLVHSTAHENSTLRDLTNLCDKTELVINDVPKPGNGFAESFDSPVYETAAEGSPSESVDVDSFDSNYTLSDMYPLKRRRQSDLSSNSFEDSQDSSEGNDILIKSIKLHANSDCLIMKELKKEHSDSSGSNADSEIPYIDAEDLPVIKPSADTIKLDPVLEILSSETPSSNVILFSPGTLSESSDTYFTPCDVTPVSESNESFTLGPPKPSGLSKSPTVLKNLANFELLAAINESRKLMQSETIEEENAEEEPQGRKSSDETSNGNPDRSSLKRTSSDISEASESDTLTYGTVRSHLAASSDCDSDTYVTVWSDKSLGFERKFSDLSENSSSPYNTPPDTSSASFCTPPDTYSPILNSLKKHSSADNPRRSSNNFYVERTDSIRSKMNTPTSPPPVQAVCDLKSENNGKDNFERLKTAEEGINYSAMFDSPKLEFYETNDSVENLEAFLQTEEGLEVEAKYEEKPTISSEGRIFEINFPEAFSKRNSLESPKLVERRSKKYPPLSRQNSTEEYLLDPHDSCLNLSEEISSPSTTPDTSNKTVIFKNVPLTVSNTIDLEDDFSISETELQVNFDGSQIEILEMEDKPMRYTKDVHCLSEPCTPSISSADFLVFSLPRKHRSSFTDEALVYGKSEAHLPEIVVSNMSSESENSNVDVGDVDFASNVSDRSEVHLSDVNSTSLRSDNSGSTSEHSDNVFSSDSDKSSVASHDFTRDSSSSENPPGDQPPAESSAVEPVGVFPSADETFSSRLELSVSGSESGEDMPMSTRKDSPKSSPDFHEVSSASDRDSDNSRDVNLNSKKFVDCNLIAAENKNNNDESAVCEKSPSKENSITKSNAEIDEPEAIVQKEGPHTSGISSNAEDSVPVVDLKKKPFSVANSSTPKPESAESQALCTLFSISSDFSTESENKSQTYLVPKTAVNQTKSLSNEEICKKFQDLSFAFRTDSMTIPKRLHLMKRKRDQAESNIEKELTLIKAKLKTLQYLGLNSDYVQLMTDLKKQLDFVLTAVLQLSSSAESYGYAQHEEKLLEFVTIMLQHVENVETSKNDSFKLAEKLRAESRRSQAAISLDNDGDEDRMLRRRSVAVVTGDSNSRRRASIATLPRMGFSVMENGNNAKGVQSTPTRPSGGIVKRLSFSQASPRTNGNNLPGIEDVEGEGGCRHRKESRNSEGSMGNIEEFPERPTTADSDLEKFDVDDNSPNENSVDPNDSSLHLKQLYESIEEIRRVSNSQEHVTAIHYLRRINEWNKLLLNSTRFRWPETSLQYVPFYLTWYAVVVLGLVFMGGLFTGINGCYIYSCLKYSALWFIVPAILNFIRRYYRFLLPLLFTFLLALTFLFLWLTEILLPQLTRDEIDSLFRTFGLEIRYLYGPPPV